MKTIDGYETQTHEHGERTEQICKKSKTQKQNTPAKQSDIQMKATKPSFKQAKLTQSISCVTRLFCHQLTHWPLINFNDILDTLFSNRFWWWMIEAYLVKLPSHESHRTLLMISQHYLREWHCVVRQQAITWANVDPVLYRHMASLGLNELKFS